MKKTIKLTLRLETIRRLRDVDLRAVVAGVDADEQRRFDTGEDRCIQVKRP